MECPQILNERLNGEFFLHPIDEEYENEFNEEMNEAATENDKIGFNLDFYDQFEDLREIDTAPSSRTSRFLSGRDDTDSEGSNNIYTSPKFQDILVNGWDKEISNIRGKTVNFALMKTISNLKTMRDYYITQQKQQIKVVLNNNKLSVLTNKSTDEDESITYLFNMIESLSHVLEKKLSIK